MRARRRLEKSVDWSKRKHETRVNKTNTKKGTEKETYKYTFQKNKTIRKQAKENRNEGKEARGGRCGPGAEVR